MPSASVDLDQIMQTMHNIPDLHFFLAKENNIDTYSYLYDAMESHDLEFEDAKGLAEQCLNKNTFDIPKFEKLWKEQENISLLQEIAQKVMGIENLDESPELKQALLEAFRAGKEYTN